MASSRWVLSGWIRSTEPEPSSNSITWIGQRAGVTQRLLTNLKLLGMQDSFGSILVSLVWNNCSILTYAENYEFGTLKSTVFIRNGLNWQNSLSYWDSRWFVTSSVCQGAFKTCATYVRVLVDYKETFLLFKMPNIYTTSAKAVILTHNTNTTVLGGRWAAFMSMTFGECKNISAPLHPLQCWYIIINLQILHVTFKRVTSHCVIINTQFVQCFKLNFPFSSFIMFPNICPVLSKQVSVVVFLQKTTLFKKTKQNNEQT